MLKLSNLEALVEQIFYFFIPPIVFLVLIAVTSSNVFQINITHGTNTNAEQHASGSNHKDTGKHNGGAGDNGNRPAEPLLDKLTSALTTENTIGGILIEMLKKIQIGSLFFQTLISISIIAYILLYIIKSLIGLYKGFAFVRFHEQDEIGFLAYCNSRDTSNDSLLLVRQKSLDSSALQDIRAKIKELYKKAEHTRMVATAIEFSIFVWVLIFAVTPMTRFLSFGPDALHSILVAVILFGVKFLIILVLARKYNLLVFQAMYWTREAMFAWTKEYHRRKTPSQIPDLPEHLHAMTFRYIDRPRERWLHNPKPAAEACLSGRRAIADFIWPPKTTALKP